MRKLEVLLGGMCIATTLGLFGLGLRQDAEMAQVELGRFADDSVSALDYRMDTYLQSLNGLAAFVSASQFASQQEYEAYVRTLDMSAVLRGITGIGFVEPVRTEDLDRLVRENPVPDFTVHPDTDGPEHFVVTRIAPLAQNAAAMGLDLSFEAGRRRAAQRARALGAPQMTPILDLANSAASERGFLILRALWETELQRPQSPNEKGAFKGWVYASFMADRVLSDLTPNQGRTFRLKVFEGDTTTRAARIFDSAAGTSDQQDTPGKYAATRQIEMFGQRWTLMHQSTPAFDARFRSEQPWTVLVVGLLLSGMLIFSMRSLRMRGEAQGEVAALRARQVNAQEAENRAVVENAVTPIFILDARDRIMFANQAAQACFGYGPEEITQHNFEDLVTENRADDPGTSSNATGVTRTGQPLVLDLQRNAWTGINDVPRTTAIVRDLTSEFDAIGEISKTKTLYDQALRGAQIGVFDLDLTTGKSEVSDTWRKIMGVSKDEPACDNQHHFLSRVHSRDRPLLEAADRACIEGESERSMSEYRVKFGDTWRWMHSDAVVVERDAQGRARRMIGTQTDVTDLRHARNALEAREEQFRQLIAAAPIGMVTLDHTGKFTGVNPAFCELCGYDEATLTEELRLSDLVPHEDMKTVYGRVGEMVLQDGPQIYIAPHRFIRKSGEIGWCLIHISWILDKNTGQHLFIAQVNDITDQKKIEQMKNEFVATVSHELRTPLTSIKGALGLIEATQSEDTPKAMRRLLEIARSNADRLTVIVNDILDLEKISSGDLKFDLQDMSMVEAIQGTVEEILPFAATHDNVLALDLPEAGLAVFADAGRTRQVLTNLISNACKYSDANTEVLIKAEEVGDQVLVCVQNLGPPIAESFRSRIFDAFTQMDSSDTRSKGGTGLGLNIARQIVRRHGGEIGFESTPSGVTVFWFTYPLRKTGTEVMSPEPAVASQPLRWEEGKIDVLHVEDDHDFAEVLQSELKDIATVRHAHNLREARAALSRGCPEVVILDWSLPDGDASCLLDEISEASTAVRILALSADGDHRRDDRLYANLVKSRTEMSTIADYVSGQRKQAS